MENIQKEIRENYIKWVRENFGFTGDKSVIEMDNAVAEWWLKELSSLLEKIDKELEGEKVLLGEEQEKMGRSGKSQNSIRRATLKIVGTNSALSTAQEIIRKYYK